jgi:AcrR family transcriptional regulator
VFDHLYGVRSISRPRFSSEIPNSPEREGPSLVSANASNRSQRASKAPSASVRPATPSAQRREQGRAEARQAILNATEALLVEGGEENLSMRRLAERCGYTAPAIYHYFEDKTRLIDALLEERFARLLRTLKRVPQTADAVADMRAISLAFARFGLRNPSQYQLLMRPRDPKLPPPPAAEAARALLELPLSRVAAEGRLRIDVTAARQSSWAMLHGLITLQIARADQSWHPKLVEVAVDALIRGLVRSFPARSVAASPPDRSSP